MLLPGPADLDDAGLAAAYAVDAPGRHLRANMVASVDGAAYGPSRRSRDLNGPADLRVFRTLRALADAVLVGAGTARAERYGPVRLAPPFDRLRAAAGLAGLPRLVVVSASCAFGPADAFLDGGDPVVLTAAGAPAGRRDALRARGATVLEAGGGGAVDLPAALDALAGLGLRHVLCEGGPRLLGDLAAAGLLDELCLTLSPCLVGGSPGPDPRGPARILDGPALPGAPLALEPTALLAADGFLFGRWRVPQAGSGDA